VVSMVLPASRTRAFPTRVLPFSLPPGSPLNPLTHRVTELVGSLALGWAANRYRREKLDLPARPLLDYPHREAHGRPIPWLFAHSPAVIPHPADWPPTHHTTGYWFLDSDPDWQPPANLAAFLEAGTPPVYVGFGSMAGRDPVALTRLVVEALDRAGQRGVLLTGWAGVSSTTMPDNIRAAGLPDTVFPLVGCPHDWLFPRMAAVVHHGGAGTTGAGLRAGVPPILVPFMGDQPFWSGRVKSLGVGPQPIPRGQLNARRLAYAIRVAVEHEGIRARAASLGEKIRAEDGVGEAVRIIEAEIAQFRQGVVGN
jgi:sterol 3beta-glucosyltransferase